MSSLRAPNMDNTVSVDVLIDDGHFLYIVFLFTYAALCYPYYGHSRLLEKKTKLLVIIFIDCDLGHKSRKKFTFLIIRTSTLLLGVFSSRDYPRTPLSLKMCSSNLAELFKTNTLKSWVTLQFKMTTRFPMLPS